MSDLFFVLNGLPITASYEHGMSLLDMLRESCGITSAKSGCSQGFCGCCTVLVDDRPALACLKKPDEVAGHQVTTLEGIPPAQRQVLARSFVQEGAVQCGFCTPGIVMRSKALLDRGKATDRDAVKKALRAHLCRCTGYTRIVDAIETAGEAWARGGAFTTEAPRRHEFFGELYGLCRGPVAAGVEGVPGVGASSGRYRGEQRALGEQPFVADLRVPEMLHGAFVLAAQPRARVLAIDVSAAQAMPGVVRVFTAGDVPGERFIGLVVRDWPIFVATGEITRYVGDVLAFVVANSQPRARRAAQAVRVDHEVLTPITSPEQALALDAPALHPSGNVLEVCAYARGDVDHALAASPHVVTARFQTQRIEHAYLEPEACLAVPVNDDRGDRSLKVYTQGQGVHDDQAQIAAILGVTHERVDVELVPNGGAFGGKEDLSIQGQTALAAWLLARPVKTVLTREQSILMHPKRHPLTLEYTAGCDRDGHLTAVRAHIVGDTGAYASVGGKVLERAAGHACGPYRVPNVEVEAKAVYTNNPVAGAMRGFGANQAAFAIEGIVDMLAEKAGLDRWEMRARNVLLPGDRFATGQIMTEACGIKQTLDAVRDVFRSAKVAGIACGIKNTGIGNGVEDIGRVLIRVLPGERLHVLTGFTEMGQGLFTILRQVIAHETGLDLSIMEVATRSDPEVLCGMTTASRATALAAEAGRRAARALAEALRDVSLGAMVGREFHGDYICNITVRPGTNVDNPVTHMTFGYATQVVVLDDNGRIDKVVAAHDVGRAINPLACAQQIEGAVHMGLGYALSEELRCTDGRPDSLRLKDLGIIPATQTPEVEVILLEIPDPVGGYGAKGVGEIGLVPTAAAVASALWAFDGVRRTQLPMRDSAAAHG